VTNSTTAIFGFSGSDTGHVAGFECSLDGAAFAPCTSPKEFTDLADGPHTFEVQAFDDEGARDPSPAAYTWTIDTEPPVVTITAGPATTTKSTAASFTFNATDAGSGVTGIECELDGAGFAPCVSPKNFEGLATGSHTFRVVATDEAGNTSDPVSRTWQIIAEGPPPAITAAPPAVSESSAATFEFGPGNGASGATTFECSLDAAAFAPCTSPQNLGGLAPGTHSFAVRSVDEAEDTSEPTVYSWTVAAPKQSEQATPQGQKQAAPPASEGPEPTNGEKVVVAPEEGKVLVKLPGSKKYVNLEELKEIPIGAIIDATAGKVRLTSIGPDGTEQSAAFFGGVFKVKQKEGSNLVVLELLNTTVCTRPSKRRSPRAAGSSAAATASAAGRSGSSGKLWGSGHGSFRTEGNQGSATVRGTIWLVEDRCNGTTFFRTRRGIVSVRDFTTGKTLPLPAGKTYVAGE
jgi:hypothetical protein